MAPIFSIIALISGRGSNFQSLVDHQGDYTVTAVVTDKPDAPGLTAAREHGIPIHAFGRGEFPSVAAQKERIFKTVSSLRPDLICLAGYMQIVPENFIRENLGRVVNIHPSLLPKYPGLDTHTRAIAGGETLHGCSVHYVDVGVDTGPVIAQSSCAVSPDDTPESLRLKVLAHEHELYPWVVGGIARGEIDFKNGVVGYTPEIRKEAERRRYSLPFHISSKL